MSELKQLPVNDLFIIIGRLEVEKRILQSDCDKLEKALAEMTAKYNELLTKEK